MSKIALPICLGKKRNSDLPIDNFIKLCEKELKEIIHAEKMTLKSFMEDYCKDPHKYVVGSTNHQILHKLIVLVLACDNSIRYIVASKIYDKMLKYNLEDIQGNHYYEDFFNPQFKSQHTNIMFELNINNEKFYDTTMVTINTFEVQKKTIREYMVINIKKTEPRSTFYTVEGKEPRIYINCDYQNDCEFCQPFTPKELGYEYCMKTIRTMFKCKETRKKVTIATPCFFMLFHTKNISKLIFPEKKKEKISFEKMPVENLSQDQYEDVNQGVEYKSQFINIVVPKKDISEFEKAHRIKKPRKYKGGNTKAEHIRRSHVRRYKSGKVIEVKSSTINKGKGMKTYYIK